MVAVAAAGASILSDVARTKPGRQVLAIALVAASLALTGCLRADVDLTVTENRTVEGTMHLAWDKGFLDLLERDPTEAQQEILDDLTDDAPDGMTCEPWEEPELIGAACMLEGVSLDEINQAEAFDQRLTLLAAGDDVVLSAIIDLDEVPTDNPDLLEAFEASVRFTFPGRVSDATGRIDGTTVTWEPQPGERTELLATAELASRSSEPFPVWIIVIVTVVVLLVAGLMFAERMPRRRDRRRPEPPPG
jgi:hypothetical protein